MVRLKAPFVFTLDTPIDSLHGVRPFHQNVSAATEPRSQPFEIASSLTSSFQFLMEVQDTLSLRPTCTLRSRRGASVKGIIIHTASVRSVAARVHRRTLPRVSLPEACQSPEHLPYLPQKLGSMDHEESRTMPYP